MQLLFRDDDRPAVCTLAEHAERRTLSFRRISAGRSPVSLSLSLSLSLFLSAKRDDVLCSRREICLLHETGRSEEVAAVCSETDSVLFLRRHQENVFFVHGKLGLYVTRKITGVLYI